MNNLDTTLNVLEFLTYCVRENSECYGNLENLVKEIQSFVRMKDYDDLVIKISDIDGSLIV